MSTISISSNAGLVLNASYTNPIDILSGVLLTSITNVGVSGSGYAWTISDQGYVKGTSGFVLSGGELTLAAASFIIGTGTTTGAAGVYNGSSRRHCRICGRAQQLSARHRSRHTIHRPTCMIMRRRRRRR